MLTFELGIVTILIVTNGLLAMSELAIVSSRPARLAALAERNVKGSRRALALASDPGKFLSTVQIGITLIGVLSGAFSGATLGSRLSSLLIEAGWSRGVADTVGVGVVVTVITYVSLIIGELVPKQIALRDPESVAVRVAPYMMLLAKISLPAVWLLDRSGKALLWLLGHRGAAGEKVSEDEIRTLVVEAENAGVLEPGEKEMIAGVMRLGDLPVGAVMTPRRGVSMINLTDTPQAIRSVLAASSHSHFVVFDQAADAAVGIVKAKDMLDCCLSGQALDIGKLLRPAPVIPEFLDARDVVAILRDSTVHMGLVHDEYGAFQGVVTSADILESIVGGFHTEEGPPEAAATRRDDGSYLISGWMPAVEFASAAYDFPADLPGFTRGAVVELNRKDWAVRAGLFQVPSAPNSDVLTFKTGGAVVEFEERHTVFDQPGKLRLGIFANRGNTGNYRTALAISAADPALDINNVMIDIQRQNFKYGFYVNAEQQLMKDVGLFARASWNDGRNQILSFTDIDRSVSAGLSVKGSYWGRPSDTFGLGGAINGLSNAHRDFLAAGGLGLLIGDGRLNYSNERILETYYAYAIDKNFTLTANYQLITNPAYNADRGPVHIFSGRFHGEF